MLLWLLSAKWLNMNGRLIVTEKALVAGYDVAAAINAWKLSDTHGQISQIEEITIIRLGDSEKDIIK